MAEKTYEELRSDVIEAYKIVYKDSVAMDACKVPKDVRIRMLDDPEYIAETKAIKAHLFIDQLDDFVLSIYFLIAYFNVITISIGYVKNILEVTVQFNRAPHRISYRGKYLKALHLFWR